MGKIIIDTASNLGLNENSIINFYKENWPNLTALCNQKFYKWQFKSTPGLIGVDNCVIAYDSATKKIAGVMGLNPRPFSLNSEFTKGAELTTWVVCKKYIGVGGKMLMYLQNHYDVLVGMGITDAALPIYLKLKFRYLRYIPRFVKIFNTQSVDKIVNLNSITRSLCKRWNNNNNYESYIYTEDYSEFNSFLYEICKKFNMFSRVPMYLKWRYKEHPVYNYQIFIIVADKKKCLICFRIEDSLSTLKILHVMDCVGDDEAIPVAFRFIEEVAENKSIDAADFFCTAANINKYPLSLGWFSLTDDTFFQFPHLFHPIQMKNPPTTSLIYWSRKNFGHLCDFSNFYITKQDCDFDRPVFDLCNAC